MSAGQLPSDPNFWDSNSRKIIFGVGGGAVGGSQIYHQHKENKHNDKMLAYERNRGLNNGTLNPYQYIMRATEDGIRPRQMKDELHAWGKKWKGTNFADPEAFNVSETWKLCDEDPARFFPVRQKEFVSWTEKMRDRILNFSLLMAALTQLQQPQLRQQDKKTKM